ncbi:5'-methylthioadenosine/S-adenosylhomocysteine nucleosidase [Rubellimicrobium roseum]|uniref:5'-methylthioadenosine/S-adenosylhomocysteine nucleosidase n=1 Tax=Rubellimicrobium roseum TaxID=687525 RepID=A0A5C4NIM7_9RHOB|nr:5'-methylthioadenosine/S-adenosylhomocysteine nucleosidase [Rubellimicrobium roseum]TNC73800.1 5'-methylthioadenosine/S-adenosylhomocysteine nucleosidase [Rubellimicrobium roseum]
MIRSARILALALLAPGAALAQPLDSEPRIAVMSAFEPEWTTLLDLMEEPQDHVVNGVRFVTGELGGRPVVLFLTGVSMVNAAMNTQLVIDRFNIEGVVFSGIAGGVDPALAIGDVVVASEWSQYLESVFARETDGDFALPPWMEPSGIASFGMIHPQPVGVTRDGAEGVEQKVWFPADPDWLRIAEQIAANTTLEDCGAEGACLSDPPQIVVGGKGVSGQAFVDNAEFREWVHATFEAQVLDMESAAVAHVAYTNDVPFIAFRSLSDLAGGGEGANEMGTFMGLAAGNSAAVVTAFLEALPD